jgi:hypothetical protein
MVPLSRVNNGDIFTGESAAPEKLMADGETSRASSNNNNLVTPASRCHGRSGSETPPRLTKGRRSNCQCHATRKHFEFLSFSFKRKIEVELREKAQAEE